MGGRKEGKGGREWEENRGGRKGSAGVRRCRTRKTRRIGVFYVFEGVEGLQEQRTRKTRRLGAFYVYEGGWVRGGTDT
jgi:hypothetical protein